MTDDKTGREGLLREGSSLSSTELQELREEIARLERMLEALADISHRRRLEVRIGRLKNSLQQQLERIARSEPVPQQTEIELERYRAITQALAEQMPAAVTIVEAPSGKVVYTNKHLELLIREPLPETDNLHQYDQYGSFHPDGRPYAAEEYPVARAITEKRAVTVDRMYYRRADGKIRIFFVRAFPVRNPQGEVVAGIGITFDVTDE